MPRITILGAGISGLATAWFLKQRLGSQISLMIIEKNPRAGGWIQTLQTDGFLFEQGPRSCRTRGGEDTLTLIEALGLQEQVIHPHPDAKTRYLFDGQQLRRLPQHLWEVPFNSLTRGWLKALWRDGVMPRRQAEDECIHAFFSRRLGISWTENLIDPFVSGIYAGNCQRLSLKSCFPLLDQWERQAGSLLFGAWRHRSIAKEQSPFVQKMRRFPLFSFREGMETLPRTLTHHLQDCLSLGQAVKCLNLKKGKIEIELEQGQCLVPHHVISTLPIPALRSLLAAYPSVATKLDQLPYASLAVINIGFTQPVLPHKGFGYLIPSRCGMQVLGCVWDSCIFPQQNQKNQTRLTLMMGGSHHPEIEVMSEAELIECALQVLRQHLNIQADPQIIQIKRAHQAIPQFEVGHSIWKQEVQEAIYRLCPHLTLSGNAWTGVSLNDCIAQAHHLAERIALQTSNS